MYQTSMSWHDSPDTSSLAMRAAVSTAVKGPPAPAAVKGAASTAVKEVAPTAWRRAEADSDGPSSPISLVVPLAGGQRITHPRQVQGPLQRPLNADGHGGGWGRTTGREV